MANSLGGLALTAIAAETLPVLQAATPAFSLISTDFSSDVASIGSAVATRIPAAATATAYDRANGYVNSECYGTSSAVTVTLNKHYHMTLGFDDSEVGNIGLAKLQSTFIQPAVYAIVNQAQSDLFGLITTAFPGVYSASYQNFGFTGLTTCAAGLDNSGSNAPRAAFLGTNLYYDVLDDLKAVSVVGADSLIRAGNIGQIAGVQVALAPTTTFGGGSVGSGGLAGFFCGKDALAMAARVPAVAGSAAVEIQNVTDPKSGFTLQLRQWYSPDRGMHMLSAVAIYGVSRGNTSSGLRILTTD